ncbi:hypothetical protein [Arthrobacter sp. zg-Y1110]|uniref:hypothetical protein n=1 Tax=Arthrobacter sp. zg-Y1110 TaxID=2886932 RepID=UPI001D140D22|nr:hypothetical protein [Arthrobacter sp. zg-Y1110]MCC3292373.1 hypothetical protein [Arthrobacter sp. zg-Y1110]UWX86724.1 hypothetical protein N2K99_17940 [Arthrobacter sp. zg-Y1110]
MESTGMLPIAASKYLKAADFASGRFGEQPISADATAVQSLTDETLKLHAGSPHRVRGRWKASCSSCTYWTGYVSESKAEAAIGQHVMQANAAIMARIMALPKIQRRTR